MSADLSAADEQVQKEQEEEEGQGRKKREDQDKPEHPQQLQPEPEPEPERPAVLGGQRTVVAILAEHIARGDPVLLDLGRHGAPRRHELNQDQLVLHCTHAQHPSPVSDKPAAALFLAKSFAQAAEGGGEKGADRAYPRSCPRGAR